MEEKKEGAKGMNVAIIGGGAAGCFAAINLKRRASNANVTVYESGKRLLAKVAITGGGRCNLTNSFNGVKSLSAVYPRGERLMKRLFHIFDHNDTFAWFEREGVNLVTQDDECVFPMSQDAMEIVNTLVRLMRNENVAVRTGHRVRQIEKKDGVFHISFADESLKEATADAVIVTTGGCSKNGHLDMLNSFGLEIAEPVPSLFSICIPGNEITSLMGTVVENASVGLAGTKLRAEGALLITHWGMSGPAILKLSSYAARVLHDCEYKAKLTVNWLGEMNEAEAMENVAEMSIRNPQKKLASVHPQQLNARLWATLLKQGGLNPEQRWGELGRKSLNRIVNTLINSQYDIDGKNRFKEEFVTCGGVALNNINPKTLECRSCEGLYFAGEVLDVDAITGGFNLQAAWTTAAAVANTIKI